MTEVEPLRRGDCHGVFLFAIGPSIGGPSAQEPQLTVQDGPAGTAGNELP
ncbi:hypothetical protein [Desulfovibrio sp.]|nr:hypothetical protein [Desulfovibrio sp.]